MADTITPKLLLTKPEIGASADSWGNKLNTNFDLLDQKVMRNTIQWTLELGDEIPTSSTGAFIIRRFNNAGVEAGQPIVVNRQTGDVTIQNSLNVSQNLILAGLITATGNITAGKVFSTTGAILGPISPALTPGALAQTNFSYVSDHLAVLAASSISWQTYNLYYEGGLKHHVAGFGGQWSWNATNGSLAWLTTAASGAINAAASPATVATFVPTGLSIANTLWAVTAAISGALSAASATISGALSAASAAIAGHTSANTITVAGATVNGNLAVSSQVSSNTVVTNGVTNNGNETVAGTAQAAYVYSTGNIGAAAQVSGNTVVANGITSNGNLAVGSTITTAACVVNGSHVWTQGHFGWPVTNGRLVLVADYTHFWNAGLAEPYGGAVATGQGGLSGANLIRYRYMQLYTTSWFTIGYA